MPVLNSWFEEPIRRLAEQRGYEVLSVYQRPSPEIGGRCLTIQLVCTNCQSEREVSLRHNIAFSPQGFHEAFAGELSYCLCKIPPTRWPEGAEL